MFLAEVKIFVLGLKFHWSLFLRVQLKSQKNSGLVQVMAFCHQATSLNQCWPRSQMPCGTIEPQWVNSLWPGRFQWNSRWVLFKPITVIDGWDTCCEIAPWRMSLNLTDGKSTLVGVMAWCRQATSHYLSQCWPSFLSPYGVTRP